MINHLLRIYILFFPVCIMEILLFDRFLKRTNPIWPFIIVWLIRIFFFVFSYFPSNTLSLQFVRYYRIVLAIVTPLQSLVFVVTYLNDFNSVIKILSVGLMCEGITSIIHSAISLVVNIIKGNGLTTTLQILEPFQWFDLLFPILSAVTYCLLIAKGKSTFEKVRHYEFKHPFIIGCIIAPIYIVGWVTTPQSYPISYSVFYIIDIAYTITGLLLMAVYLHNLNSQRRSLRASSLMIDNHYQLMQARIDNLALQQQEINDKMAILARQNFPDDLTEHYLADMKQLKDNLHQSLFTHYYMIDAVLADKAKEYKEQGKAFNCQCAGLTLNQMSQQKLSQILLMLFRYVDRYDPDSLSLKLSSYQNQVVIVLDLPINIAINRLKHQLKQLDVKELSIKKQDHSLYLSMDD